MSTGRGTMIRIWGVRLARQIHTARPRTLAKNTAKIKLSDNDHEELKKLNIETFERLSEAYQLIGSKNRFSWSAYKCIQLYSKNPGAVFLEDLMRYPRINKDMLSFLFQHYDTSTSIRNLVLNDMCTLVSDGRAEVVSRIFVEANVHSSVPESIMTDVEYLRTREDELTSVTLQTTFCDIVTRYALLSGEHLIAASLAVQFNKSKIPVSLDTVQQVIQALSIDTNLQHSYHVYTILKLLDVFGLDVLSDALVVKQLHYFCRNPKSVYFANELFARVRDRLATIDKEELQASLSQLVVLNTHHGLHRTAISVWDHMDHDSGSEPTIDAAMALLETSPSSSVTTNIIDTLGSNVKNHRRVVDFMVEFYGTNAATKRQFDALVATLTAPLERSTHSALFAAFLYQNHEEAAERILSTIFKSKNGLTARDFYHIINKLLQQGNLDQCIAMAHNTAAAISRLAYPRIFSELSERGLLRDHQPFMNQMYIKLLGVAPDDQALEDLTVAVVAHLANQYSIRAAKKLYLRINQLDSKSSAFHNDKYYQVFNFEKYAVPNRYKRLVTFSPRGRRRCLENIAAAALAREDTETLRWAIDEMRVAGATISDILHSIFTYDHDNLLARVLVSDFVH